MIPLTNTEGEQQMSLSTTTIPPASFFEDSVAHLASSVIAEQNKQNEKKTIEHAPNSEESNSSVGVNKKEAINLPGVFNILMNFKDNPLVKSKKSL